MKDAAIRKEYFCLYVYRLKKIHACLRIQLFPVTVQRWRTHLDGIDVRWLEQRFQTITISVKPSPGSNLRHDNNQEKTEEAYEHALRLAKGSATSQEGYNEQETSSCYHNVQSGIIILLLLGQWHEERLIDQHPYREYNCSQSQGLKP